MSRRARWTLAGAALLALAIKLLLALKTYGSNDVYLYDQFSFWTRYLGVFEYEIDPMFNHPPSMIYFLHFLSWLAGSTGLPFSFWIRLPSILADTGTLWLVWKLLPEDRSFFWPLLLLACSPTLILISGFHGNTDSVVMFLVVLCVFLVEGGCGAGLRPALASQKSVWLAGAVFGLANCFKVIPVIVAPVILLHLSRHDNERMGWRNPLRFCAAAGAVILAAWSPFLFQDPRAVIGQVFGYRSSYGQWGLSYLGLLLPQSPWAGWLNAAFERWGAYIALGLVWLVSLWINFRWLNFGWLNFGRTSQGAPRPRLFPQVGLAFLLFLSVSAGFGVQYLAWLAPWVVELGWAPAAFFYSASGVFLFLVYNYWAQGLPWYLADSVNVGDYPGHADHAQLICWFSVLVALAVSWRGVAGPRRASGLRHELLARTGPARPSNRSETRKGPVEAALLQQRSVVWASFSKGARWRIAGALAVACTLLWVVPPQQSNVPDPPVGKDERAVRSINADSYVDLAQRLAHGGRYEDAIRAAGEALALQPDSAEARAAISASQAALRGKK